MEDLNVLVVDDSKLTRHLITQALHTRDILHIVFAEDGEEAKEKMEGINLVITDWMMPRLDGLGFTRWLRAQTAYQHLPVIMITSNFDDADLSEARQAGVDVFCEKSFSVDDLFTAIDAVADRLPDT